MAINNEYKINMQDVQETKTETYYQVLWRPAKRLRPHIDSVFCLPCWISDKKQAENVALDLNERNTTGSYEAVKCEIEPGEYDLLPINPGDLEITD